MKINEMEKILLYVLNNNNSNNIVISKEKLFNFFSGINKGEIVKAEDVIELFNNMNLKVNYTREGCFTSNSKIIKSIHKTLDDLRKKGIIDFYETIVISSYNTVEAINENGLIDIITEKSESFSEADDDFRYKILKFEREALSSLFAKDKNEIVAKGFYGIFNTIVENKIKENIDVNINYYYRAYKIIYDNEYLSNIINRLSYVENNTPLKKSNRRGIRELGEINETIYTSSDNKSTKRNSEAQISLLDIL